AMVRDDLGVDDVERQMVDIHRVEIEQRIAEGLRGEERDVLRRKLARGDELLDEAHARLGRFGLDRVGVGLHEAALLDEGAPEGAEGGSRGGHQNFRKIRTIVDLINSTCKEILSHLRYN